MIRKNKSEIPQCFLDIKKRSLNSTIFRYGRNILLLSYYVPRKNKNVIIKQNYIPT